MIDVLSVLFIMPFMLVSYCSGYSAFKNEKEDSFGIGFLDVYL